MALKTYIVTASLYGRVRRLGSVRASSAVKAVERTVDAAWLGAYDGAIADVHARPARGVK